MSVEQASSVRAEVLSFGTELACSPTLEQLRQEAETVFRDEPQPEGVYTKFDRPARHANPLDSAIIIAEAVRCGGLDEATRHHIDLQRATRMAESRGSFDNTVVIRRGLFGRLLDTFGEPAEVGRYRAVLLAQDMERKDSGFGFYVRRTMFEFLHKKREQAMMDESPVGTAISFFSPCQEGIYGRRLGMFPERDMAVWQISWKQSQDEMVLRSISLDRANLGILRQLLAEQGVEPAADAKPEDYLAYIVNKHFDSQEELNDYVQATISRFDQLVKVSNPHLAKRGLEPRQGVVQTDPRNMHTTVEQIMDTAVGQLALQQEHKLDMLLVPNVLTNVPLDPAVHALAQKSLHGQRSNGEPLLLPSESNNVRATLSAPVIDIENEDHVLALDVVARVYKSAIEESLRDFLGGDEQAMNWMHSSELTVAVIEHVIRVGTVAIENGRSAEGCGCGGEIGGLPNHLLDPDGYLKAKYGINGVRRGTCALCGRPGLVGTCNPAFCGRCDGNDSLNPGYIGREMQLKKLLRQMFALAA